MLLPRFVCHRHFYEISERHGSNYLLDCKDALINNFFAVKT